MTSLNLVKLNIAIPIKSKLWQHILHESFLLISTYLPKIHLWLTINVPYFENTNGLSVAEFISSVINFVAKSMHYATPDID